MSRADDPFADVFANGEPGFDDSPMPDLGDESSLDRMKRESSGAAEPTFSEPCKRCRGTGVFKSYTGRVVGPCNACKGAKTVTFKTSPAARQKAREAKEARAVNHAAKNADAFAAAHPERWKWIVAKRATFAFANAMREAVMKFGALTEKQAETVDRLAAQDAERDERIAREKAERESKSAAVDLSGIVAAFAEAAAAGIKRPRLRLDTFKVSVGARGIYVTDGDAYLGKIADGRFHPSRDCDPATVERIVAACADPRAAALAYGQRTGACSVCGRTLTKAESINAAIGPICAGKFGWSEG